MGRSWGVVFRRFGLVALGLLAALVAAEVGLRIASPVPREFLLPLPYKRDAVERIAARDAYISFDHDLGWVPTADSTHVGGGITYQANRAGLRSDREYEVSPAPGTRRIAAFGDSFTYCEEVDFPDCWTARLEDGLDNSEVLNFGAPGYGPDQALLRYQRDGRAYGSCAVLIGYLTENVNRVVNRFRPFYEPNSGLVLAKPRFLLGGDGLTLLANPAASAEDLLDPGWVETELGPNDRWYFPGVFVPNPLDRLELVRLARTAAYRRAPGDLEFTAGWADRLAQTYRRQDEPYQVAGRVLIEFARLVRRDGATPVVIVFATRPELEALHSRGEKDYQPLLDWLAREGIPTVDVDDALVRQVRSSADNLIENHYTGRGNRLVAEALSRQLPRLIAPTCDRS